ncbi:MerR-like DNA binding protein [Krasilnikovia cinnamomea]|uniref:MerR-like DNA binding protein n=1 Tax=Krasilnikovia cinnamomea TaxID=349313 RepID=A0A4V2G803_9ACTN|nr:MerR family transcriptional regulator [Krasilnikovia cinnamomea]RZU54586.1 MerR-like DNA binding protein [Krasilnikovia cinnamomea]
MTYDSVIVVGMWTMDELVERVRLALAAQYPGAPNGRIRDLPDRRAIRWYATTGLVDRPAAMRGRTALYGPRHLLQLVALKRRQAAGRSLAEIQAELAGAGDAQLAEIARIPPDLLAGADPATSAEPPRTRFWADPPAPPSRARPAPAPPETVLPTETALPTEAALPTETALAAGTPLPTEAALAAGTPLAGVALGGGAVLLVPGSPRAADLADIATAAQPLIDLLATRGLLATNDGSPR